MFMNLSILLRSVELGNWPICQSSNWLHMEGLIRLRVCLKINSALKSP